MSGEDEAAAADRARRLTGLVLGGGLGLVSLMCLASALLSASGGLRRDVPGGRWVVAVVCLAGAIVFGVMGWVALELRPARKR